MNNYVCNVVFNQEEEALPLPEMKFDLPAKQDSEQRIPERTVRDDEEPLTIPTMNYKEKECVNNFAAKMLEDKTHLVVPVVMAVEGVLNGSNGALFYPADELQKSVHLWNGKPVVVFHPDMFVSGFAGHPEIFNKQKVGVLFNARFEGKAIKAEAWLDPERLKKVDRRVLEAVHNQKVLEVSTGLFTEDDDVAGTFNGKNYVGIARNYQPDHLAILPDQKGACSIADGAGLCRNLGENEEILLVPQNRYDS